MDAKKQSSAVLRASKEDVKKLKWHPMWHHKRENPGCQCNAKLPTWPIVGTTRNPDGSVTISMDPFFISWNLIQMRMGMLNMSVQ
jgi:hypothetical protein